MSNSKGLQVGEYRFGVVTRKVEPSYGEGEWPAFSPIRFEFRNPKFSAGPKQARAGVQFQQVQVVLPIWQLPVRILPLQNQMMKG